MRYERPGAVTAAAIMCLVYGVFFTCDMLCGVVLRSMHREDEISDHIEEVREREVPGYLAIEAAAWTLNIVETTLILVGGIGLLGMNRWARSIAIVGGLISISTSIFGSIYCIAWKYPATRQAFAELPAVFE